MIIKYNLRKCALKIHESEHRILHEMHSILDMLRNVSLQNIWSVNPVFLVDNTLFYWGNRCLRNKTFVIIQSKEQIIHCKWCSVLAVFFLNANEHTICTRTFYIHSWQDISGSNARVRFSYSYILANKKYEWIFYDRWQDHFRV
jgi:hypothetical protein